MARQEDVHKLRRQRKPTTTRVGTCKLVYEGGVCNGELVQTTTPIYKVPKDFIGSIEPSWKGDHVDDPYCKKCGVSRKFVPDFEKD